MVWDSASVGCLLVEFATAYADQNERHYEALVKAAATGRITVESGFSLDRHRHRYWHRPCTPWRTDSGRCRH